jgi:beta-phosphoglucomutase-like phosphatase (HAD superfamily)
VTGGTAASLVCCGLIGTVVDDKGILERAFAEAGATQGIVPGTAAYAHFMVAVHQARGEPPVEVFRGLFPGGDGRAEAAALSFERSFRTAVDRTSLAAVPRRLLGVVMDALGWWQRVDLALCPDDAPRGCPWPDLMLAAMLQLGVEDVRDAVYAGSTASGVRCGRRSGAGIVAGVLSGGHTKDRLRAAGATHLIEGIADLPPLLAGRDEDRKASPEAGAPAPRVPLERRSAGL